MDVSQDFDTNVEAIPDPEGSQRITLRNQAGSPHSESNPLRNSLRSNGSRTPVTAATCKSREEKLRQAREELERRRVAKMAELEEQDRLAERARQRVIEERKRRMEEAKRRTEERHRLVEERRKKMEQEALDRRQNILRKFEESWGCSNGTTPALPNTGGRSSVMGTPFGSHFHPKAPPSSAGSGGRIYAFGSSSPRDICQPLQRTPVSTGASSDQEPSQGPMSGAMTMSMYVGSVASRGGSGGKRPGTLPTSVERPSSRAGESRTPNSILSPTSCPPSVLNNRRIPSVMVRSAEFHNTRQQQIQASKTPKKDSDESRKPKRSTPKRVPPPSIVETAPPPKEKAITFRRSHVTPKEDTSSMSLMTSSMYVTPSNLEEPVAVRPKGIRPRPRSSEIKLVENRLGEMEESQDQGSTTPLSNNGLLRDSPEAFENRIVEGESADELKGDESSEELVARKEKEMEANRLAAEDAEKEKARAEAEEMKRAAEEEAKRVEEEIRKEKEEAERLERQRQEEAARVERKKKLESIMSRVKPTSNPPSSASEATPDSSLNATQPPHRTVSPSLPLSGMGDESKSLEVPPVMSQSMTSPTGAGSTASSAASKFKSPLLQSMISSGRFSGLSKTSVILQRAAAASSASVSGDQSEKPDSETKSTSDQSDKPDSETKSTSDQLDLNASLNSSHSDQTSKSGDENEEVKLDDTIDDTGSSLPLDHPSLSSTDLEELNVTQVDSTCPPSDSDHIVHVDNWTGGKEMPSVKDLDEDIDSPALIDARIQSTIKEAQSSMEDAIDVQMALDSNKSTINSNGPLFISPSESVPKWLHTSETAVIDDLRS